MLVPAAVFIENAHQIAAYCFRLIGKIRLKEACFIYILSQYNHLNNLYHWCLILVNRFALGKQN